MCASWVLATLAVFDVMKRGREFAYYTLDMCRVSLSERGKTIECPCLRTTSGVVTGKSDVINTPDTSHSSSIRTQPIIVLFTNSNSINTGTRKTIKLKKFLEDWHQLIFKNSTRGAHGTSINWRLN